MFDLRKMRTVEVVGAGDHRWGVKSVVMGGSCGGGHAQ